VEIDLYGTTQPAMAGPEKVDLSELFDLLDRAVEQRPAAIKQAVVSAAEQSGVWRDGKPPMRFDEFCIALDPKTALFPRQLWVFDQCGMLDPWNWIRPDKKLTEFVLEWGKGSGKDFIASRVIAYFTYVILHIAWDKPNWKTPAEFYGRAADSLLAIVNIAPNARHAQRVFFGQYLSKWFKHELFAPFKPFIGKEEVSFYTEAELARSAATKGRERPLPWLVCYSLHSQSSGFDGMNVLAWVMDEADDFLDTENRSLADELYDVLKASAGTRFNDRWLGVVISYPRIEGGFMERTYATAVKRMKELGPNTSVIADKAATWDVNTETKRDSATVLEQYEKDPAHARAMYECMPMKTEEAFFDMPDRITAAVDDSRSPIALVKEEYVEFKKNDGSTSYFISASISNIVRKPGHAYYLGGDAGKDGDAFALSVFHVDTNDGAFEWICPRCALQNPTLRSYGDYSLQGDVRIPVDQNIRCGSCAGTPQDYAGGWTSGVVSVRDWWRRSDRAESALITPGGEVRKSFNVPHVYEDLLVRIKPVRKVRSHDVERPVYFPGVQDLCYELMVGLGIAVARFDPWQTATITQGLMSRTGGDVAEISFSQPEQYKRGRLVKYMLYADLITLLPSPIRDKEYAQLQSKNGSKLDHPPGGSKDCYDAESVAIWTAVSSHCNDINLFWG
jgi:hypothetical protein